MAKKKTTKRRSKRSGSSAAKAPDAAGKHLVIVESPAKAKTINKYLGPDYVVMASVGHIRDLPKRNPKGVDQPVPGVDIEDGFKPTYELITGKGKTVQQLKKAANQAEDVWLATDLDREGEAIAWHLAEALGVPTDRAKRVVFNAITKNEITRAFEDPHTLDMDKVNAQQARRILDRIVGYQVSPLLWKKVAGGLSAGRVQSVAVRLVAEREREIQAFVPEEYWKIAGYFTADLPHAKTHRNDWAKLLAEAAEAPRKNGNGNGNSNGAANGLTQRQKLAWLAERGGILTELVEANGEKVEPKNAEQALQIAQAAGFELIERKEVEDPRGKGPAKNRVTLIGAPAGSRPGFAIESITTKRTGSRPGAPFITSTLQQAAANRIGFTAAATMRAAQQLYEGVDLKGMGQVGLITYMRTDSTHLSGDAIQMARDFIGQNFGDDYLPAKPNFFGSTNKQAQEAHEAIRPTDVTLTPDHPAVKNSLNDQQYKLYRLIWERFVACQMTPAQWDSTTVLIAAGDGGATVKFRGSGRTLVFDGHYKVCGAPHPEDEAILPKLAEGQTVEPLQIDPMQKFTSPPPRYSEASLVKKLESEGIGRPSTYAQIISVIQQRKYVEKIRGRFHCTDLGGVVTDKLTEGFPRVMDIGYTRDMEAELDAVEEKHHDWVEMLRKFYGPFQDNLAKAHELMSHAKAETQPAPYKCPDCGGDTMYRFGKNGRFLSCANYPECKYASPVDREGKPIPEQHTDIACPKCGAPMAKRKGRFGEFLSCSKYPDCDGIVNLDKKGCVKHPTPPPLETDIPCDKCDDGVMNLRRSKRGPWLSCNNFPKCKGRVGWKSLEEDVQKKWELELMNWEKQHPQEPIKKTDGSVIGDDYTPHITGEEDTPEETNAEYSEV